jgi:hypothetical protein
MLERRLSAMEQVGRWGHLLLCRHCRAHARQIQGLLFVLNRPETFAESPLHRLSPSARARIAAAIADADRN